MIERDGRFMTGKWVSGVGSLFDFFSMLHSLKYAKFCVCDTSFAIALFLALLCLRPSCQQSVIASAAQRQVAQIHSHLPSSAACLHYAQGC